MTTTYRFALGLIILASAGSLGAAQPHQPGPVRTRSQPLTYSNIISHFKDARFRATEVQKRCTIFFEGEWKNAAIYDYGLIIVENSDEDIQVTFYLTDAHEMNWITEFLDAPFFSRAETEKLFDLMNSNKDVRNKKFDRFSVDFHHWRPRHAEIIVFSFTPLRGKQR